MCMGVDETRRCDQAGGVDDLRALCREIAADGPDLPVLTEDVRVLEDALRLHGIYCCILD